MKVQIKKHGWSEVTLSEYRRINEIIKDENLSSAEKDIALLAILCEVPEDKIWEMNVENVRDLRTEMLWLNRDFDYPKTLNFKKIKVGDWDCKVESDITKMTYAQFVDFETYISEMDEYKQPVKKAEVLSVFIIPEGHKYGDGYDVLSLQKAIDENVSYLLYSTLWAFFFEKSKKSLTHTSIFLASKLRARSFLMRKSNPLKEKYIELSRLIKESRHLLG